MRLVWFVVYSAFLVTVTVAKAEYKWNENNKEWVWEEETAPVDESYDDEASGDDVDSVNSYDNEGTDDYEYGEGSGDYGASDNGQTRVEGVPRSGNIDVGQNWNTPGGEEDTDSGRPRDEIDIVDGPPVVNHADVDADSIPNGGGDGNNFPFNDNNDGLKTETHSPPSFFAKTGTMAAVIGGAVVGLLCAILCVMFVVYRMRKKDEGSYALDEPKRSPTINPYTKPPSREFYA